MDHNIDINSDQAIRSLLKMSLNLFKDKAAIEAMSEYKKRRQSKYRQPRILSFRPPQRAGNLLNINR
jgi:hypothetical protein